MVAIDENGKPREVPGIYPETETERRYLKQVQCVENIAK